ncbi:MAG: class I SAM-dependent methyltransferase [Sphingomonadaceae bacterium]
MQAELIAAANLASLPLGLYLLHKVRAIHLLMHDVHDRTRQEAATLFRQIEAVHGLYAELGLQHSLPPTRGWAASPDFLLELVRHVRSRAPHTVLECSSGVSTLVLARCLQLNGVGKVLSLEHDPVYAAHTREQLRLHGLLDWAAVIDAPLVPQVIDGADWIWYDLTQLPMEAAIDLLVIDGPPQAIGALARYPAGPRLFERLAAHGCVFLDDAARPDERAIIARWQQENPALALALLACEKGCAVLQRNN